MHLCCRLLARGSGFWPLRGGWWVGGGRQSAVRSANEAWQLACSICLLTLELQMLTELLFLAQHFFRFLRFGLVQHSSVLNCKLIFPEIVFISSFRVCNIRSFMVSFANIDLLFLSSYLNTKC